MRAIRMSGLMSGDGKRGGAQASVLAPILDSTKWRAIELRPALTFSKSHVTSIGREERSRFSHRQRLSAFMTFARFDSTNRAIGRRLNECCVSNGQQCRGSLLLGAEARGGR
jgi:hypothetical protein